MSRRGPVPPHAAYDAVRDAFVAHARGEWTMQPKVYVTNYPAGDFRAMPALGGGHALLKWVTSFPGNPARGLPTVIGARRCSPTRRTDACSRSGRGRGHGTAHRRCRRAGDGDARPPRRRAGGGGRLRRERRRDRPDARRDRPPHPRPRPRRGAGRCRRRSTYGATGGHAGGALAADVVITVTPGKDVLYREGSLREGQHVSLMGADGPGKAEVATPEIARAHLFCDDWEQASGRRERESRRGARGGGRSRARRARPGDGARPGAHGRAPDAAAPRT